MESEPVIEEAKSRWRLLCVGFLLGVLVSFLALVVVAFKWGPQGESVSIDLYSGNLIKHSFFLSRRTHTELPKDAHVQWAIDHQYPVKSWYQTGSNISRSEWFGEMMSVDFMVRPYVYDIYSLSIPEDEKVQLLHQYHQDLDALKSKQDEYVQSHDFWAVFNKKWEKKVETLQTNSQQSVSLK